MTWRLHRFVLYSHDRRSFVLPEKGFAPVGVSVIIGDSNTGKSALLEIVNYCLGSTNCEVADFIRQRCSWVGIQLKRNKSFLLVCRQIPRALQKSSSNYSIKVGTTDEVPSSSTELRDVGIGALNQFEQLLGVGSIQLEDPATASGFSVSIRHCVPYSLVRDDIIINKDTLVSGARDERARHLRETLPYFLGHITEATIRVREQLRRRRAELRTRQAEFDQRQSLAQEGSARLVGFVDRARSLGMLSSAVPLDNPEQQRTALMNVAQFRLGSSATPPESERYALEQAMVAIRRELMQFQERRRAVYQTSVDANAFGTAASGQLGRLAVMDLLHEDDTDEACPVCSAKLLQQAEPVSTLRTAMEKLREDIGEVAP